MARVLVTGGMGYIGSHTVVELIKSGHQVFIIDDLSNSSISVLDGIEKITGQRPFFDQFDLLEYERLRSFFVNNPVEAIIHFAASKAVGESVQKPLKYYQNNLNCLMNLMACMLEFKVPNLIFSSSCTVYGTPLVLPVSEQEPTKRPESPYGNTKKVCEEMLTDLLSTEDHLNAISLRYFNPIGAHESALIGENPNGIPDNLIPYITQTAAGIRDKLQVFGNDYGTPDGTCIRDYLHVSDLAKAHVVALNRLLSGQNKENYETFNLGTGTGYSVLDVIRCFEETNGLRLNYEIAPRRAGDIEMIYADPARANQELGWKAEKGLKDMVASAWKWQQSTTQNSQT